MAEDAARPVRLDMGLDHREFFRLLPAVAEGSRYRVEGRTVRIAIGHGSVAIALGEERSRALGPTLKVPATSVEIAFEGLSAREAEAFVERFRRHYRRGGG